MSNVLTLDWFTGILVMLMGSASSEDDDDDDDIPAGQCCKNPKLVEKEYRDQFGNKISETKCENCGYIDRHTRFW